MTDGPPPAAPTADWTWTPQLELRTRLERRIDPDFLAERPDDRSEKHFRLRAGVRGRGPGGATATLVYQFGYAEFRVDGPDSRSRNSDLFLGNLDWTSGGWRWIVGRQNLSLGEGRLFTSTGGWGNVGRTFDGVVVGRGAGRAFVVRSGVESNRNPREAALGLVWRIPAGEVSLTAVDDARPAGLTRRATLAASGAVRRGRWTASGEAAVQGGHDDGRRVEAGYAVARAGWANARTEVALEAMAATGGPATGGVARTFRPAYPNHAVSSGLNALFGYRNQDRLTLSVEHTPDPAWRLSGLASAAALRDPRDAWYALNNRPNRGPAGTYVDPTGASGRDLGWWWQVEATWSPDRRNDWTAGFGALQPGRFQRSVLGAAPSAQHWAYVQWRARF